MTGPTGAYLQPQLFLRAGGSGDRLMVLLHGMGAQGSVWSGMAPLLAANWAGRWLAPDLRGHGRSVHAGPYAIGSVAADIAALIAAEAPRAVTLVGHSFGGAIAAVLASDLFGVKADHVFAIGVKLVWTDAERTKAHEMARRPAMTFADRAEAIARSLKLAGLAGLVDPGSPEAAEGVVADAHGGYRAALDPRAFAAVGPDIKKLLRGCTAPLHLLAGENDPLVSLEQMREIDREAVVISGSGHNVHVEAPDQVWRLIIERSAGAGRPRAQPSRTG